MIGPSDTSADRVGYQKGKSKKIARDFGDALRRVNRDYFCSTPKYGHRHFERRFRLLRSVFDRIERSITGRSIFVERDDAVKKKGIHHRLRITAALRMIAYGVSADALDE